MAIGQNIVQGVSLMMRVFILGIKIPYEKNMTKVLVLKVLERLVLEHSSYNIKSILSECNFESLCKCSIFVKQFIFNIVYFIVSLNNIDQLHVYCMSKYI